MISLGVSREQRLIEKDQGKGKRYCPKRGGSHKCVESSSKSRSSAGTSVGLGSAVDGVLTWVARGMKLVG